jgi:ABC-type uncharacterized transport system permease subunit
VKQLRFYLNLYRMFLRTSLVREMEFRANFWAKVLFNLLWLGFFLLTLKIIYRHTEAIAGWREPEALVLAATLYFLDALITTLFYFGYRSCRRWCGRARSISCWSSLSIRSSGSRCGG